MSIEPGKLIERFDRQCPESYAVIIAFAISQAIQILLKTPNSTTLELNLKQVPAGLPAFVAFLVTLVPFWQGMNRHLERCYLEKKAGVRQRVVFIVEAIFLFAAGWSIKSDIQIFYWIGGLLGVDMVWAFVTHYIHFPETRSHAGRSLA